MLKYIGMVICGIALFYNIFISGTRNTENTVWPSLSLLEANACAYAGESPTTGEQMMCYCGWPGDCPSVFGWYNGTLIVLI